MNDTPIIIKIIIAGLVCGAIGFLGGQRLGETTKLKHVFDAGVTAGVQSTLDTINKMRAGQLPASMSQDAFLSNITTTIKTP
jgi:H+/Cl- antiporter ClcA